MPSDDLILSLKQIAGYPVTTAAASTDAVLIQRGGLGGPYQYISAMDLVASALAQGGTLTAPDGIVVGGVNAQLVNSVGMGVDWAEISSLSVVTGKFDSLMIGPDVVATTRYVDAQTAAITSRMVTTFMGRTGDILLGLSDIVFAGGAPLGSPNFWGCPTAPTAAPGSNNFQIANTAFVASETVSYINNLLQTQPFVFTFNGRSGNIVLTAEQVAVTAANTLAPLIAFPTDATTTMQVVVNGRVFAGCAVPAPFTVTGNQITWASTLYGLAPGDEVIVRYQPVSS